MKEQHNTSPPGFPSLQPSQYALLFAEVHTGYVLALNGERYIGTGERFLIFDSLEDAEQYATQKVENQPEIEGVVYDHQRNFIKFIRSNKVPLEQNENTKSKAWWKFW